MSNVSDPAKFAAAITPNDSNNITPTRGIYVGGAGNIACVIGGTTVTFVAVQPGILPVQATKILATGTTATSLVALW